MEVDGEHVCVTINRDGKLFLVEGEPLVLQVQTQTVQVVPAVSPTGSGDAPETDCALPPLLHKDAVAQSLLTVNYRDSASRHGVDLGDISAGELVRVVEGPVSADNYFWLKVRKDDGREGWAAESGNGADGCEYFLLKPPPPRLERYSTADEREEAIERVLQFHTDAQLKVAEDNIIDAMVFVCDAYTSAGGNIVHLLAKESLKKLMVASITEAVRKGSVVLADYTASEVRRARDRGELKSEIPEVLTYLAEFLEKIPTGVCSSAKIAYEVVAGDALLDLLEGLTPDTGICEIHSESFVPAFHVPQADGYVLAKVYAKDGLHPVGAVQLPYQPRFYMLSGSLGSPIGRIGPELTVVGQFLRPQHRSDGAVFVYEGHVEANGACDSLVDLTELVMNMDLSGDNRDFADPRILLSRYPDDRTCTIIIDSPHRLFDTVDAAESPGFLSGDRGTAYGWGIPESYYQVRKFAHFGSGNGAIYLVRVPELPTSGERTPKMDSSVTGWYTILLGVWPPGVRFYLGGGQNRCHPGLQHIWNFSGRR